MAVILKCTLGFPQTWQKHDSWLTTAELFWLFDHKELEWGRTRKKTSSSPWVYCCREHLKAEKKTGSNKGDAVLLHIQIIDPQFPILTSYAFMCNERY